MKNQSIVKRGLLYNDECRFYLVNGTNLIQEISEKTEYSKTAIAALGRSTMISAIIGLTLKNNEKVSTIIDGGGTIGQIIVTADANGKLKAKVSNPKADIENLSKAKLNVGGIVGTNGSLRVIKDLGMKDPFVSDVPLISGEIAEDYTYYFTVSEQIPTAIAAGVLINPDNTIANASALIIQLMPGASEETIEKVENTFKKLVNISKQLNEETEEEFLNNYFNNDYKILEEIKLEFSCDCSEEKFKTAIQMLSPKDLLEIKSEPEIECVCDFCHKKYFIQTNEL